MTMFGEVLLLRKTSYIFDGGLIENKAVTNQASAFLCLFLSISGSFRGICVNQCVNREHNGEKLLKQYITQNPLKNFIV